MTNKYKDSVIDDFIEFVANEVPCFACPIGKEHPCEDDSPENCNRMIRSLFEELSK